MATERKIITNKDWDKYSLSQLKQAVKVFYAENLSGKSIKNKQKGITVVFANTGLRHLLHARTSGYVKLKAISVLPSLIEQAKYSNFKAAVGEESKRIVGYFNFTSKVFCEGKMHNIHITIRLTNNGKFYYDHSLFTKK